jgi:hypothetical protein
LLTYSEDFGNAAWTKTNTTVTTNAASSPNGTVTADLIQLGAGTVSKNVVGTVSTTAPCTLSVYAKAGTHSVIQLLNSGTTAHFCNFDLSAGTVGNSGASTSGSISSVGNGWYRCTAVFSSTIGTGFWIVAADSTANGYNPTTSSTGTLYLWGAQLSVGPYPLDYTPTTTAAVYGPRFDFDPVTLAAKGLLIEEQRTNLATYSEQFNNAAWTKGNGSITANAISSPDGAVTADKFSETSANAEHYLLYGAIALSAVTYTASVYLKAGERSWANVYLSPGSVQYALFDLINGVVGATTAGITASIQNAGNGWWRCSITKTTTAANHYFVVNPMTGNNTNEIYAGTSGSGIYVWGAQLEAGSFATSYIPTVASTVTRSADVASVNTLSPWMNEVEGTIYAEVSSLTGALALINQSIAEIDTGVLDNRNKISRYNGVIYGTTTNGGVAQADFSLGNATSANTVYKAAYRFKANDFAGTINGGTVQTDTSGTVPSSLTKLWLGNNPNSDYLNGHLRRVAFYPRALTAAELQAITA